MIKISSDGLSSPDNQPLDAPRDTATQGMRPSESAAPGPLGQLSEFADAVAPAAAGAPRIVQDILASARSSALSPLDSAPTTAGLSPDFAEALTAFQTALPMALRATGLDTAFWQDRTAELQQLVALTGAGSRGHALPESVGTLLDSFFDHLGRLPDSGLSRALLGSAHGLLRGAFETVQERLHLAAGKSAAHAPQMEPGHLSDAIRDAESQQEQVRNERQMVDTAFQNFDQKANQLYNLLSSVMKTMNEMRMGSARNML